MARPKFKLSIDPRHEYRESEGKLYRMEYVEKFDDVTGEVGPVPGDVLNEAMLAAGWSDDPGTGQAILLEDGRELLNPTPIAPPVNYDREPSINDLVERALKMHFERLKEDDVIDSLEDADDFGDDIDEFPISMYEVQYLRDEAPAPPAPGSVPEGDLEEVRRAEAELPQEPIPKPKAKPPKDVPKSRAAPLDGEEA